MLTYYIDKSGHSGDLISNTGTGFDYAGQPYSVLAAVGISNLLELEGAVAELRMAHKIPFGELKAKSLQSKTFFVAHLLNLMLDKKYPIFVEVVDKRYFICIQTIHLNQSQHKPKYWNGCKLELFWSRILDEQGTFCVDMWVSRWLLFY